MVKLSASWWPVLRCGPQADTAPKCSRATGWPGTQGELLDFFISIFKLFLHKCIYNSFVKIFFLYLSMKMYKLVGAVTLHDSAANYSYFVLKKVAFNNLYLLPVWSSMDLFK